MAQIKTGLRSVNHLFLIVLAVETLLVTSGLIGVVSDIFLGRAAEPLRIELFGPGPEFLEAFNITFRTDNFDEELLPRVNGEFRWELHGSWVRALYLHTSKTALANVRQAVVRVGSRAYTYTQVEIAAWMPVWTEFDLMKRLGDPVITLGMPPSPGVSRSAQEEIINWPAPADLVWRGLRNPLLEVALLLALGMLILSERGRQWTDRLAMIWLSAYQTRSSAEGRTWLWSGFTFVVVALVFLELRQPLYFTQDDNFSQFLPVVLQGCRGLFGGTFPHWNPYQFLGAPTTTLGVYALTYPVTYLSYAVARFLLGNEALTFEVFAFLHILAGYLVVWHLLRAIGLRLMLSALGSACFALSGFALVVGRSWYYMLPTIVWTSLLALALVRLAEDGGGLGWAAGTGVSLGLFFHAGNAQMWLYAVILFGATTAVMVAADVIPLRRLLWLAPALLVGAGISLPLMILQMNETHDIYRIGGRGIGILAGLTHMLLPLGPLKNDGWWGGSSEYRFMGQLFYSGTIFVAAALGGALLVLGRWIVLRGEIGHWKKFLAANPWMPAFALAFVFGLGNEGILWMLMAHLPVLDKFNHPVKFMLFVDFFALLAGGMILERWMHDWTAPKEIACTLVVVALLSVHLWFARGSFYDFSEKPYPKLPHDLAHILNDGHRTITIVPDRSTNHYAEALPNNLATVARVPAFAGYDPLVQATWENRAACLRLWADPIKGAREYGIRWMVVHRTALAPRLGPNPILHRMETLDLKKLVMLLSLETGSRVVYQTPDLTVREVTLVKPLAYRVGTPEQMLPVRFDVAGAKVETASVAPGEDVVLNVLWRPWMEARTENGALETYADNWGRIRVRLTQPTQSIEFCYAPPWKKTVMAGAGVCFLGFALGGGLLLSSSALSRFPVRNP